jgi:4-amino-4-deoxy-L-arabinose transferase-like glycosyltransferase
LYAPDPLWPGAVFLLALLPRLVGLGARPFWLDEVFTLQRVSLNTPDLVRDSFYNHHMPSFFLMLRPFLALGHPEFWLRVPSAVFGAVAVTLVFVIARRIGGVVAGALGALVLGLSPIALAFSQEARSYTLEMSLILVALYGITRLAQDLPAACGRMLAPQARAGWLAYIFGTGAALDVLGDGLPWLLAANLIAVALAVQAPSRRAFLLNMLRADLAILLLCAPFYLMLELHQEKGFVQTLAWIPPLDFTRIWYSFGSVYFMRVADSVTFRLMALPSPLLIWVIDTTLAVAVAVAGWRLRRKPAVLAVLGISLVFLPLLLTAISLWQPILLPRYMLWSSAPFAILAGIGASALLEMWPPRTRGLAVAVAVGLLGINAVSYYRAETKPRWDLAAQMLAQEVAPGDVLYLHDFYANKELKIYLPPDKQPVVLEDSDGDLAHAAQAMSQGKRVWAVYGLAGQGSEKTEKQGYLESQAVLGQPTQVQSAGGRIVIVLYDPAAGQGCAPPAQGAAPGGCH